MNIKNVILTLVLICIFYIVLTMNLYFILDVKHMSIKQTNLNENHEIIVQPEEERNIENFRGKKLIALTFDDGPNENTTKLLVEGLKKRNSRSTFFMVGKQVIQHAELVKLVYDSGNEIGNHSYSHCYLTKLTRFGIINEINRTDNEIEKITGEKPKLLRPPYGNYNGKVINSTDKSLILWNVDPEDWKYKNSDLIYNHIITHAKDGNIIVLHEGYETTVDGALRAIDTLKEQGYELVTISEMAKLKNYDFGQNKAYFYMK